VGRTRARKEFDARTPAAQLLDERSENGGFFAVRAARLQDDLGLREIEDWEGPAGRVRGGDQQQLRGRFGEGRRYALTRNNRAALVDLHPDVGDATATTRRRYPNSITGDPKLLAAA
jgi:hypothetical protein